METEMEMTERELTVADILEPYLTYDSGEKCLAWYLEEFIES